MDKEPISPSEVEGNFKLDSGLYMTTHSPELGFNLQNHSSQQKYPSIYSPNDSPTTSPKNLLLRNEGPKMLSFRSQPSVYTEGAIKIEMKTLKDANDDHDNDSAFFRSMTQEYPKDKKGKLKITVAMNQTEEDKQEVSVQGKGDERGAEVYEGYAQDSLDPQVMKDSFGDQVLKLTHTKFGGKKASGFRRDNDKFNRLKRQFTDTSNSSFKVDISLWDLICSFFNKNGPAAQRIKVLRVGILNIQDRLDIFNLLKKLREIDKLKALLLEEDHRVLFNGLPKPEIKLSDCKDDNAAVEKIQRSQYEFLKGSKFVEEKAERDLVLSLYRGVLDKNKKSKIDQKLIEIYDKIFNLQSPAVVMSGGEQ